MGAAKSEAGKTKLDAKKESNQAKNNAEAAKPGTPADAANATASVNTDKTKKQ